MHAYIRMIHTYIHTYIRMHTYTYISQRARITGPAVPNCKTVPIFGSTTSCFIMKGTANETSPQTGNKKYMNMIPPAYRPKFSKAPQKQKVHSTDSAIILAHILKNTLWWLHILGLIGHWLLRICDRPAGLGGRDQMLLDHNKAKQYLSYDSVEVACPSLVDLICL